MAEENTLRIDMEEVHSKLELLAVLEGKSKGQMYNEMALLYYTVKKEEEKGNYIGILIKSDEYPDMVTLKRFDYEVRDKA